MKNKPVHNRLRRVSGQVATLTTMIDEDTACEKVIPQFLAIKGALDAAFEAYVHDSLMHCKASDQTMMKTLITTLIRK